MTYKIAVSAGHYEDAQGATRHDVTEYQVTTKWQDTLIDILEYKIKQNKLDVEVHRVTRGRLGMKVAEINGAGCDLAIEIHFNAASNDSASGCETLIYPGSPTGLEAAQTFQLELTKAMQTKSRGIKDGWYRMDRPGVVDFYGDKDGDEMPDYFLRKTNCTALIIEPEFLAHIQNIRERRSAGCEAIARGVLKLANRLSPPPPKSRRDKGDTR